MNLRQLYYFTVIAKHENITKAAEALFISQPSLSQSLRNLEGELGCKLFDRQNNKLTINSYGLLVLKHAENIFLEISLMEEDIKKLDIKYNNRLVIASNNYTLAFSSISNFLIMQPDIAVEHFKLSQAELINGLIDESIDFVITNLHLSNKKLDKKIIACDKYVVLVPLTHRLASQNCLCLEDIESEKFVASSKKYNGERYIDALFKERQSVPPVVFEGETGLQLKIFESLNALKIHLASQIPKSEESKAIPIDDEASWVEIFVYWLKGRTFYGAPSLFYKYLKDNAYKKCF